MPGEQPKPTDAELIALVRAGDRQAYGPLYERHRAAALRVARIYARDLASAEDLVAEAFTRVLAAIDRGNGPDESFRPYLYTTLRRTAFDWGESDRRVRLVEDISELEVTAAPFNGSDGDPADEAFDRQLAARAFTALPERWQIVLWHLEVEEETPAEVAPLLDLSASAVSALAYRAREGLRQAYLQAHLAETVVPDCRPHASRLGAFVRKGLGTRATASVQRHLDTCPRCSALQIELLRLNGPLREILAPLMFGSAAAVKVLASIAVGAAAGGVLVAGGAAVTGAAAGGAAAGAAAASGAAAGAAAGGAGVAGGASAGAAADATGKGLGILGRMLLKARESGKVQAMTVVAMVVAIAAAWAALQHTPTAHEVNADPPAKPPTSYAFVMPPAPTTTTPPPTPSVVRYVPPPPPRPTPTPEPSKAKPLPAPAPSVIAPPTTEPPSTCPAEPDGEPGDCEPPESETPEPPDTTESAPPTATTPPDTICVLGAEAAKNPTYENIGLIIAAETDPMCQGSSLQWTTRRSFGGAS